jgi:hypothetical protein
MSTEATDPPVASPSSLAVFNVLGETSQSVASDDDKSETGGETNNSADVSVATSASGATGGDTMEIGPMLLTKEENCMVIKGNGNIGGALKEACKTRNHQELQKNQARVGKGGVYNGVILSEPTTRTG